MKDSNRLMLVEDDKRLAALVKEYLGKHGYEVMIEGRGDTAADRIHRERPDLVILDLMLPGKDGLAVCQSLRADFPGPILILTAREDDMDQVAGLEMGADDYIKKPVVPRVLLARIRALLRRFDKRVPQHNTNGPSPEAEKLAFGALKINRTSHTVIFENKNVTLTTNEFELLWYLAVNSGQVMGREKLYRDLRGIDYDGLDRSMDVVVSKLRKKLGDDAGAPQRIKTIWGQGYLFVTDAW